MTIEERYELSCYEELTKLQEDKEVYLVRHNETGEIFVKKYVSIYNEQVYRRLQQEMILQIPQIELLVMDEDKLIVIEEYVHGVTLETMCRRNGLFSEQQLISFMIQLCSALERIHGCDVPIIHRDIKPSNVMVSKDGVLKLIDFSIAKEYRMGSNEDTVLMGTQGFAAPEQCGFGQSDERTDIYGVGITMNYLLTGSFPKDYIAQGNLKDIIVRCVSMDANSRYQSAKELKYALIKLENKLYDNTPKVPDIIKNGRWRRYLPVGFRTGRLWKMLVAVAGYALIYMLAVTTEIRDENGELITGAFELVNRLAIALVFIGSVFFVGNYANVRYQFPLMNKNKFLHWLLVPVYVFLYVIFVIFITVVIAN